MAGEGDGRRIQSETMNLILTDPQLLDCYVCYEPLSAPIFQCENGHVSCSSCCSKGHNKCASCGLKIGNIRCRSIEQLLESMKMRCRNSTYGCKKITKWNKMKNHESLCVYEPCSCPIFDCSFVGSSRKLSLHFSKEHEDSADSFSYDCKFLVCFDIGDTHRILQADGEAGCLFLLTFTYEPFGNAATVSRIGSSSSKKKYYCEIEVKAQERVLRSRSMAKEIQAWVEEQPPPTNGSLLIPSGFFESSSEMTLQLCIGPATTLR